jgi:hypothetical protein
MSKITDFTKHLKNGRAGSPPPRTQELAPGAQIQIDLKNATLQTCSCGCSIFIPAIQLYKVSALISPTGQELVANQQIAVCIECHLPLGAEVKERA